MWHHFPAKSWQVPTQRKYSNFSVVWENNQSPKNTSTSTSPKLGNESNFKLGSNLESRNNQKVGFIKGWFGPQVSWPRPSCNPPYSACFELTLLLQLEHPAESTRKSSQTRISQSKAKIQPICLSKNLSSHGAADCLSSLKWVVSFELTPTLS